MSLLSLATFYLQEKKRKRETSGEGQVLFTEIDNLVLDILGRDSPVVSGLGVPESVPATSSEANTGKTSMFLLSTFVTISMQ